MKLPRPQIYVLIIVVTLLIGFVTNIASNQLPERLKPYQWMSWPLLFLLAVALLILTRKSEQKVDGPPAVEFKLKHYYEALLKRYRTLDLDALTPPQREEYLQLQLRAVFVEQSVRKNPPPIELPKEILEKLQSEGELKIDDLPEGVSIEEIRATGDQYYRNPPTPVIDVLTRSAVPHVVILGDPGSGKSTLTRYTILSLVDPAGDSRLRKTFHNFLPVLVELRTYNALREEGKCDTFLEFLEFLGKTEGWNLTQTVLHERLSVKGAIVIFDGLDEVFDPADRARLSHAIVGFAHTYPNAGTIVTSRIVGYQRKILTDAGFAHYTLQDLNREQVASFVSRWYELALADRPDDAKRRIERILHSFDQSTSVRQLAGNPMLLTIMAIIGKHQELPRERWKLYDHAASVLIEHWEVKRHLESINVDAPFIGEDDKKELLRRLAYRMQAGGAGLKGNYIHREQLQKEFQDYLIERFTLSPDRATTISRIMIDQFRQRNFILSLYGASVYGFVHRAFLEYFCATAFTYKFEKAHEISIEHLSEKVFGVHWNDESWHEVLRLICGILNERFAGELIVYLLNDATGSGQGIQSRCAKVELALRCLAEVRNTNSITDATDFALEITLDTVGMLSNNEYIAIDVVFSAQKLLAAVKAINVTWPNRVKLAQLLASFRPPNSIGSADYFALFVSSVGAGLEEVHDQLVAYAQSEDWRLRALWTGALASGWKDDPAVVSMLKHQLLNDPVATCRRTAIDTYLTYYADEDSEAVPTIIAILQPGTNSISRYQAIRHLSRYKGTSVSSLLKDHLADKSGLVRSGAFNALKGTYDLSFALIHERILKETSSGLRSEFYDELVRRYLKDPRTRELLLDNVIRDPSPLVRQKILRHLATSFAEDSETWNLLRRRAEDDPDIAVRETAQKLLVDQERASAPTV
ncbi:MAG TPA: hypothetical protein VJS13_07200 [Pyrinomonadaceae bacterium]|nr:hypothetical protein [Pyrinomonadaceae bacterium]